MDCDRLREDRMIPYSEALTTAVFKDDARVCSGTRETNVAVEFASGRELMYTLNAVYEDMKSLINLDDL